MIPLVLKVNGITKNLWNIMEPDGDYGNTEEEQIQYALKHLMFPSEVKLTSETYCRNADRTANYELKSITNVNAKAKPEFTWEKLKATYVRRLLNFLGFKYDYNDGQGNIQPEEAPTIEVTYLDLIGMRTIKAYLGQTIEGTLTEYMEAYEGFEYRRVSYEGPFSVGDERGLTATPGEAGIASPSAYSVYVELNQGNQIEVRLRSIYDNEEDVKYKCSKVEYECVSDTELTIKLYRTEGTAASSQYVLFKTLSLEDLTHHSKYLTMKVLIRTFTGSDAGISYCFNSMIESIPFVGQKRVQYWENFRIAFPER